MSQFPFLAYDTLLWDVIHNRLTIRQDIFVSNQGALLITVNIHDQPSDMISDETLFRMMLYQYNTHIIVSRESVSYINHSHFAQYRGWICAVTM